MFGGTPLFNSPRNWKWMIPAVLIAPCVVWWNDWLTAGGTWETLAVIPLVIILVLAAAAVLNFILYLYYRWSEIYQDVQNARNGTAEVRMMEAARGMHPEAVKALLVHRRSIWRIKYVPLKDVVDWIFDEMPNVHAGFLDFVLDHSTSLSLMSKRLLSDGSKQFDPMELVTDYEQYDALVVYLQTKLMITQAYGNQAPQWLPPWSPETVRHRFGLDGTPYAVEEEGISDAMKAVMRAQSQWQGKGLKDLGATQQSAVSRPPGEPSANGNGKKKDVEEPELTAEQLEAIEKENRTHSETLGLDI